MMTNERMPKACHCELTVYG